MRRTDHAVGCETACRHISKQALIKLLIELRRATQDPEIIAIRSTDHRIFIVWSKFKNPVVTVERPKERHLQLCVRLLVNDLGFTPGSRVLAVRFSATINDIDLSIRPQSVSSGN